MEALIFNIQKFSIHDGPGIRTVVFFKGCPLKCPWCANPESQSTTYEILWDHSKCLHCSRCVSVCAAGCLSFEKEVLHFQPKECSGCLDCVKACPGTALDLAGKKMTLEQVLSEVYKDQDFYEESQGGVTLSGGEVFSQPVFVNALLKQLKAKHIHTCLETCGYTSGEVFAQTIQNTDLLLYDLKHYDPEIHQRYTGADNTLILNNLAYALKQNVPVIIRIPVIPGFNNSLNDAQKFAKLLVTTGVKKVELLPFHQFGQNKYTLLNRPYLYEKEKNIAPEALETYRNILTQAGLTVKI